MYLNLLETLQGRKVTFNMIVTHEKGVLSSVLNIFQMLGEIYLQ